MEQGMTEQIKETKSVVRSREWQGRILECQQSGKTVREWCEEHGISQTVYYRWLRRLREEMLSGEQQVVPIAGRSPQGIRITAGKISVTLPGDTAPEQLKAIIGALKSC